MRETQRVVGSGENGEWQSGEKGERQSGRVGGLFIRVLIMLLRIVGGEGSEKKAQVLQDD